MSQAMPAAERVAGRIEAPTAWRRIEFISDLHLADETPRTFDAWRDYLLGAKADAIFILGDLFEAWVGDDSRFEGFEARGAVVLREAAAHKRLFFMVGNRDFLLGEAMLADCGVQGLVDPTLLLAFGDRALLTHGDAWCIDDQNYQKFRSQVRSPAWKAQVLSRPLAERRLLARNLRSESEKAASEHMGEWSDVDRPLALDWLAAHEAPTLVHGHTHRPATEELEAGRTRHVLSDWDFDHAGIAIGEQPRGDVLRWQATGWSRHSPVDAANS